MPKHPVLEGIPTDPAEMREEIIRLREGDHVRKGEEGKVGMLARAMRGAAPVVEAAVHPPARASGITLAQFVFGAITFACAIGALIMSFAENRAGQTAAIARLTEQMAEVRTMVAAFPTTAATVQRLEGQAGSASAAREAARQDFEKAQADIQRGQIVMSEMRGRLEVQGNGLVTLQGTSTAVAALRAEVDATRRENEGRDRIQDERFRGLAEIVTSMRDALVQQGVRPVIPPRRSDAIGTSPPAVVTVPVRMGPRHVLRPVRWTAAPS